MIASSPVRALDKNIPSDWQFQRALSEGGQGKILLYVTSEAKQIAVKTIKTQHQGAERFMRGVDILIRLDSKYIIKILDFGFDQTQGPWYATPYYSRGSYGFQALTELEAIYTIYMLSDALAHAHSKNIIHRDIKPGNILVNDEGLPVIIDWDFGKAADHGELTMIEQVFGTPDFISPEQAICSANVTFATDIFALGKTFGRLTRITHPKIKQLVARMTLHEAAKRPTARQVCLALTSILENYAPQTVAETKSGFGGKELAAVAVLGSLLAYLGVRAYQKSDEKKNNNNKE